MASETGSSDGFASEQNHLSKKPNETKTNPLNTDNIRVSNNVNKEINLLSSENSCVSKKNPEMCGVHSRSKVIAKEQKMGNEKIDSAPMNEELHAATYNTDVGNKKLPSRELSTMPINFSKSDDPLDPEFEPENTKNGDAQKKQADKTITTGLYANKASENAINLQNSEQNSDTNVKVISSEINDDHLQETAVNKNIRSEDISNSDSQILLPDILSSLNKKTNEIAKEPDNSSGNHFPDKLEIDKERSPKPKSFSPQIINVQNLFSSEAIYNEMEMELKQLQNLNSLQANRSIYKLAYDENVTDQSDSRTPSPVDPESQIPSSYNRSHDEIIVHEADSDDDAGSEDVELIPHRYESESYINQIQNKNVYVNKLSLAVELLRTHENLPYDGDFKRIVGENNIEPGVHTGGKVNLGFKRDSCSPEKTSITNNVENKHIFAIKSGNKITSELQGKHSSDDSQDSAIFSDIEFSNFEDEASEHGAEAVSQGNENQDNSEAVRTGYRRFGIQAHQRFMPLPFNPCFCCTIM